MVVSFLLAFTVILSCKNTCAQHLAQAFSGIGSERLERYCKVGANLQADIEYCAGAFHIAFGGFPRLRIAYIFIPYPGYAHSILEGIAEAEIIEIVL